MAKKALPVVDDLARAGWAEADLALASAWRDMSRLCALIDGGGAASVSDLSGEAWLVRQALDRVARLRGLVAVGEEGAAVKYDPSAHDIVGEGGVRTGARVKIVAPGAARQVAGALTMLAPALVERAPAPRRKSPASGKTVKPKSPRASVKTKPSGSARSQTERPARMKAKPADGGRSAKSRGGKGKSPKGRA